MTLVDLLNVPRISDPQLSPDGAQVLYVLSRSDPPIDNYWDNSPLKYVVSVKTPTIFLVGEKDVRVPMPQSVEMYRALKSNGVPAHLHVAPREPHRWQELRHQLFKMNVELAWFEKVRDGPGVHLGEGASTGGTASVPPPRSRISEPDTRRTRIEDGRRLQPSENREWTIIEGRLHLRILDGEVPKWS
jgi:acetyl esterase/lipase